MGLSDEDWFEAASRRVIATVEDQAAGKGTMADEHRSLARRLAWRKASAASGTAGVLQPGGAGSVSPSKKHQHNQQPIYTTSQLVAAKRIQMRWMQKVAERKRGPVGNREVQVGGTSFTYIL